MQLKNISCDPMCGFSLTSHDEKELLEMVGAHAKKMHKKDVPASELKKMIKPA